jgi:hypothetical protein
VLNLAEYGRIRVLADALGVETIDRDGAVIVLKFRPQATIDPARLIRVVQGWPGAVLVPPASLKLSLDPGGRPKDARTRGSRASWWASRAASGEARTGFSKDAILASAPADPREQGGVFESLQGLLVELGR